MLVSWFGKGERGVGVQGAVRELADVWLDCLVQGLVLVAVVLGPVAQDFLGEVCDLRVGEGLEVEGAAVHDLEYPD